MQSTAIQEIPPKIAEPLAVVKGEAFLNLPKDLYIPPDAMKVFLDTFEGPLDLLLYLIRKENINILDIPIAVITQQYMQYIDLIHGMSFELAGEYLVMAAILAEIKSRMLLPRAPENEIIEDDPRAELVRKLQEYERYKKAAEDLDQLPRLERDLFLANADDDLITVDKPLPQVNLKELLYALSDIFKRVKLRSNHHIQLESISIREKMSLILDRLQNVEHQLFSNLFNPQEGKIGIVVTFLATLELLKQGLIEFIQTVAFAPIYLKKPQSNLI